MKVTNFYGDFTTVKYKYVSEAGTEVAAPETNTNVSSVVFTETGELVSYVLNSILERDIKTAYDILTGTIPNYRRQGISRTIFEKMKILLQQNEVKLYTTEVLKTNPGALELYLSVGFAIKNEVVNVIKTPKGSREVYEYEIVMSI